MSHFSEMANKALRRLKRQNTATDSTSRQIPSSSPQSTSPAFNSPTQDKSQDHTLAQESSIIQGVEGGREEDGSTKVIVQNLDENSYPHSIASPSSSSTKPNNDETVSSLGHSSSKATLSTQTIKVPAVAVARGWGKVRTRLLTEAQKTLNSDNNDHTGHGGIAGNSDNSSVSLPPQLDPKHQVDSLFDRLVREMKKGKRGFFKLRAELEQDSIAEHEMSDWERLEAEKAALTMEAAQKFKANLKGDFKRKRVKGERRPSSSRDSSRAMDDRPSSSRRASRASIHSSSSSTLSSSSRPSSSMSNRDYLRFRQVVDDMMAQSKELGTELAGLDPSLSLGLGLSGVVGPHKRPSSAVPARFRALSKGTSSSSLKSSASMTTPKSGTAAGAAMPALPGISPASSLFFDPATPGKVRSSRPRGFSTSDRLATIAAANQISKTSSMPLFNALNFDHLEPENGSNKPSSALNAQVDPLLGSPRTVGDLSVQPSTSYSSRLSNNRRRSSSNRDSSWDHIDSSSPKGLRKTTSLVTERGLASMMSSPSFATRGASITRANSTASLPRSPSTTSFGSRTSSGRTQAEREGIPDKMEDEVNSMIKEFKWPAELEETRRDLYMNYGGNWKSVLIETFAPADFNRSSKEELNGALDNIDAKIVEQQQQATDLASTPLDDTISVSSSSTAHQAILDSRTANRIRSLKMAKVILLEKVLEYDEALEEVCDIIEETPHNLEAKFHRGLIQLLRNNPAAAVRDMSSVIASNDRFPYALRTRAQAYVMLGKFKEALKDFNEATKVDKTDAIAVWRRGLLYEQMDEREQAVGDYSTVITMKPRFIEAYMRRGAYFSSVNLFKQALRDFDDAVKLRTKTAAPYYGRGSAHLKLENFDAALSDFSKAIELDPSSAAPYFMKGVILRAKSPLEALKALSISLFLDATNADAYLCRGVIYDTLATISELKDEVDYLGLALLEYKSAIQYDPTNPTSHLNAGIILMTHYADYESAIASFTAAIKLKPRAPRAYFCRADALARLGRYALAKRDYARVIHHNPASHISYVYRGRALMDNRDIALSMHDFVAALQLNKFIAKTYTQRAQVYALFHQYDQAIEVYEQAIKERPSADLYGLLGRTKQKAGDSSGALEALTEAIQLRPSDPNCFISRAQCHRELGSLALAITDYSKAIKLDKKISRPWLERGLCKLQASSTADLGLSDLNRALKLAPKSVDGFLARALIYSKQGKQDAAIADYSSAIKVDSNCVAGYVNRGIVRLSQGNTSKASMDFSMAIAIDPSCSIAYFNRANIRSSSKPPSVELALRDYSIALMLDPSMSDAYRNRGLLYWSLGDTEAGLSDFNLACSYNPNSTQLLAALAQAYHDVKQYKKSIQVYKRALFKEPRSTKALLGRGNVYYDLGTDQYLGLAIRDYSRALHLDPTSARLHLNLGYALQARGQVELAWKSFTSALSFEPDNVLALEARAIVNVAVGNSFGAYVDMSSALAHSPSSAPLLTNRGVLHLSMGDIAMASADFRSALRADPNYALAYFNLGTILFKRQEHAEALSMFTKAISLNLTDTAAHLNRGITLAILGERDAALEDFHEAIRLNPHSSDAYYNRATLLRSMGHNEAAEKDLRKAVKLDPSDSLYYAQKGKTLRQSGRMREALVNYAAALALDEEQSLKI